MTGFADTVARFSAETKEKIDRVVERTVHLLGERVVSFTHIDTGKLVSNWNYSAEFPDNRVTNALTVRKVNNLDDIPKAAAGHIHYIANGVSYAGYAEFGTSKMAPHRMLGLTLQNAQQVVDQAVREVGS